MAPWNKGLTKENDERILRQSKVLSEVHKKNFETGREVPWSKGLGVSDPRIAKAIKAAADTRRGKPGKRWAKKRITACHVCNKPVEDYACHAPKNHCSRACFEKCGPCVEKRRMIARDRLLGKTKETDESVRRASEKLLGHEVTAQMREKMSKTWFPKGSKPWNDGIEWPEMRGENHPAWRGGNSGDYGDGWSRISLEILRRDGRVCRICGSSRLVDVDHIVPFRLCKSNDDFGLLSLCRSCHAKKDAAVRHAENRGMAFNIGSWSAGAVNNFLSDVFDHVCGTKFEKIIASTVQAYNTPAPFFG